MAHMFILNEKQVKLIQELLTNKFNNEYVLLNEGNGFADIAQYSEKYDNVRLVTVRNDRLTKIDRIR